MTDPQTIASKLSAFARFTVKGGTDDEWYARTDQAGDELVNHGLARRPFLHDRRILIPSAAGIALRTHLEKESKK